MKRLIAIAMLAALIAVPGCQGGKQRADSIKPNEPVYTFDGEAGTSGGTMVLELQKDIKSLNVIRATDNITTYVLWYHMYRCLIDYRNGEDPPRYDAGLCDRWESNPEATQWTFFLRKGVQWSDGQPFTADDVLFTYQVVKDPSVDNAIRDTFVEGTDENGQPIYPDLVKLDDNTVRFDLHKPNGMFLDAIFNLWLIPKHKWEGAVSNGTFAETMTTSADPSEIVSLGPFRFKEYTPDQRVVLERNPYFWKKDKNGNRLPYLDQLIFVIGRDATMINLKFQAGEIDVTSRGRAEDFAALKKIESPNVVVHDIGVSFDPQWMAFNQNLGVNKNTNQPYVAPWKQRLFRNQKFRQAVSYAIDRQGLANAVFAGRAMPIYSFVSPADKIWYSDGIMKYDYDVERAKRLLSEIGLRDGDGDGVLEDQDGNRVEFTIITNADNSQRVKLATFIADNLKQVGLKANTNAIDLSMLVEASQATFNFDAIVLGWGSGVPAGPINAYNILLSSGLNHVCYPGQERPSSEWEARVDQLVIELPSHPDHASQKRAYDEIQRIWSEQLPEINLVAQKEAVAYYNKFGNIRPASLPPRATWNVEEIYLKK